MMVSFLPFFPSAVHIQNRTLQNVNFFHGELFISWKLYPYVSCEILTVLLTTRYPRSYENGRWYQPCGGYFHQARYR